MVGKSSEEQAGDRAKIIGIFIRNLGWLPFKKIEDIADKEGINKRTLIRYLQRLVGAGKLDRDERGYKKTFYKLSEGVVGDQATLLEVVKWKTLSTINSHFTDENLLKKPEKLVEALTKWIGVLAVYSLIRQQEKDEPWNKVATHFIEYIAGAPAHIGRYVSVSSKISDIHSTEEWWRETKKLHSKTGLESTKYQTVLATLLEALKKSYPKEFRNVDKVYKHRERILREEVLSLTAGKNMALEAQRLKPLEESPP